MTSAAGTRPARRRLLPVVLLLATLALGVALVQRFERGQPGLVPASPLVPGLGAESVLVAGDIADCGKVADSATADLVASLPGTVLALGDNAYEDGSVQDYERCYAPTWGRVKDRTRPVPGNHDYQTTGAAGYFGYFGEGVGSLGRSWYAYDLGAWRLYALDSNCGIVGCDEESQQLRWLREDLAAHPTPCVAAYWHHPLFTSAQRGGQLAMRPIWQVLDESGADLVLNGHDHHYERFAPQDAAGRADESGPREIVIGTGGRSLHRFGTPGANSEVRDATTFGVLQVVLEVDGYAWRFLPAAGSSFTDEGRTSCH